MAETSPKNTPKRKRGENIPITPIKFSFDPRKDDPAEDGDSSPRSRVAHKFCGLQLSNDGGVPQDEAGAFDTDTRKRPKVDEKDGSDFLKHHETDSGLLSFAYTQADAPPAIADDPERGRPPLVSSPNSTSKSKKRTGTPPLRLKSSPAAEIDDLGDESEDEVEITDPVRAALTWHDDEITIYDPDDEDDDGTGINGVGFKPTAAVAHARAMKRRQQMAEYKKREENEARTKRSQRRRDGVLTRHEEKVSARKVRFRDSERQKVAVTTS